MPGQLTVHADRGSSMTSKPVAFLLADLGVTKTHSRPYTSTDNPYSEAQFKTLKYRPGFPQRFGSIVHARTFGRPFFDRYNHEHRHSGIGLMTPAAVHYGRAPALYDERVRVLAAAYAARPERFVRGVPQPPELPTAAWPWVGRRATPAASAAPGDLAAFGKSLQGSARGGVSNRVEARPTVPPRYPGPGGMEGAHVIGLGFPPQHGCR